jgi:DNA-binding NarL/FixJ family response regulator
MASLSVIEPGDGTPTIDTINNRIAVLVYIPNNLIRTAVSAVVAADSDFVVIDGLTVPVIGGSEDKEASPTVAVCADHDSIAMLTHMSMASALLPVIALLPQPRYDLIRSALRAGAVGLHCVDCHLAELPNGLRAVAKRIPWLAECMAGSIINHISGQGVPSGEYGLTPREEVILKLMAGGASNADVSKQLGLELRTVKHHTSSILRKLGVRNRSEAVALAYRQGLVV